MNKLGKLVESRWQPIYIQFIGSPSAIDCRDKILFIEDLDEFLYHIDRMMMNLKRNGCLESIKGIVVGSMTKMKITIFLGEKMQSNYRGYNQKITYSDYNFPAGHIQDNRALILGSTVTMEVTQLKASLTFIK
jgi:muramoyltetrapeptide carboxypeptidase